MPLHRLFDTGLPGHVSRAIGYAADLPLPRIALEPLIAAYSALLGVDSAEVRTPAGGFRSFGDFFARRLVPGARPVAPGERVFASPCDGVLDAVFEASGAGDVLRVKGNDYSTDELLGSRGEGERFAHGGGLVVYLHPRDYHRVHAPCRGDLVRIRHIPGARFPVAPWSEKRVPLLYQKNERVVFFFEMPRGGALAVVMVAAMGVGNIESPHAPVPSPRERRESAISPRLPMVAGDELGAFRLGSTVVLLWSEGTVALDALGSGCRVRQGEVLGELGHEGA